MNKGIEEKGVKYTLKLTDASDLNRDLLKVCNFIFFLCRNEFKKKSC